MGAWGTGMQANDTALDYIGDVYGEEKPRLKDLKALVITFNKCDNDKGILGIAECLLDYKPELLTKTMIKKVDKAIDRELDNNTFLDSEDRKGALLRFRDRLNGKKVDKKDLIIDNLCMFDRMAVHGKTRDEIKAMIKLG